MLLGTAAVAGPIWWAGPRLHGSGLAFVDGDVAWAARARAAVGYAWQESSGDTTQLPANVQVIVLTYARGAAPAKLPCAPPCIPAYTVVDRADRGLVTLLLVARKGEAPPKRELREIRALLRRVRT